MAPRKYNATEELVRYRVNIVNWTVIISVMYLLIAVGSPV